MVCGEVTAWATLAWLSQLGLTVALVSPSIEPRLLDSVVVNNAGGAELAVSHLAATGHTRIAFMGPTRQCSGPGEGDGVHERDAEPGGATG